jgi:hypothetical protein
MMTAKEYVEDKVKSYTRLAERCTLRQRPYQRDFGRTKEKAAR